MGEWRQDAERWLESEGHDDPAAEAAFASLFSAMPAVEPSPSFVQRTVDAAWAVRARRRRVMQWSGVAAAAIVALSVAVSVGLGVPAWVMSVTAQVFAGSIKALMWAATAGLELAAVMARTGAAAARVAVMPQSLAALLIVELIGAGALYSLHRLLRSDVRFRNSGPLCI